MNQLSIFGADPALIVGACRHRGEPYFQTPIARNTDPETSHLAAEHITRNGTRAHQQAQTIAAIRSFPGRTMQELAELTGLDRYMLGRRVSECETAGAIRRMPKRKCRVTGRMAEPWEAA